MGDALNESAKVKYVSLRLIEWVLNNNYAKGIDGVDLSTVLPKVKNNWIRDFNKLNVELDKFPSNQNNKIVVNSSDNSSIKEYNKRTHFRLFYSIHSLNQSKRDVIIPNATPTREALELLNSKDINFNTVYHYLFVNGVNDSREDIDRLKLLLQNEIKDSELRILRYNSCDL